MSRRAYNDLREASRGGHVRLEAVSADNGNALLRNGTRVKGQSFGAFQRNFRYRLIDTQRDVILWERWQDTREGSPVMAWVWDDGYAVVRTHGSSWSSDELLLFSPAGEKLLVVAVTRGDDGIRIPETAGARARRVTVHRTRTLTWLDRHVQSSTVGPMWARGSLATFFAVRDTTHFSLRTAWGRRLVVDLGSMILLDDDAAESFAPLVDAAERTCALEILRRTLDPAESRSSISPRGELDGALSVVLTQRLSEAAPLLRRLEALRGDAFLSPSRVFGKDWYTKSFSSSRALTRLVLRAIGYEPCLGGGHAFVMRPADAAGLTDEELADEGREAPAARPARAWEIARAAHLGASGHDLLATAGPPESISDFSCQVDRYFAWSEIWEYDGPESTTRITWSMPESSRNGVADRPRHVAAITVEPAAWRTGERWLIILGYYPDGSLAGP